MNEEQKQKYLEGQKRFQRVTIEMSKSALASEFIELMDVPGAEVTYKEMIAAVMSQYDLMNGQPMTQAMLEEQRPVLMMGILTEYWIEVMSVEKKEPFEKGELTVLDLLKIAMEKLFLAKGEDVKWKKVEEEFGKIVTAVG